MLVSTSLLIILSAGLASQLLAWWARLPAIVFLIASGIILGPVTGVINIDLPPLELAELIGFGVAIILFEGGMDLKLGELKSAGNGIGRLTILGAPLAWLFGSMAAHYLAGLSWPVACVLGAILVVTGPTVILPILKQARLNKESSSLLKWEGIVNDPVGVLLAVLTFEYFTTADAGLTQTLIGLGSSVAAAIVLGGLGGWLTGWFYRRGWVPEHLKPPILMVLVLIMYWLSNIVHHEAGLLSVTLMGVVVGNMDLIEREDLQRFKRNLTVVLLSILFIVIPTQLQLSHLTLIDWRVMLFVIAILVVVRPLTVGLATLGAPMRKEDKLMLAWIAPRGIVAAATAGIFGPALVSSGYQDAEKLLPIVFLVIIVTVLVHGLSISRLARRLGLAAENANGLMIIGVSPWTRAFAQALKKLKVSILIVDGNYHNLKAARMEGLEVYYGEILSKHAEHTLDINHLNQILCATDKDFYNALVCKVQGRHFGHHRSFQLAIHDVESSKESKQMALQRRGKVAFDTKANFEFLQQKLDEGWIIQTTKLSDSFGLDQLKSQMGTLSQDWLLLGSVSASGGLRLFSTEQSFSPEAGWTLLYFGPEPQNKIEAKKASQKENVNEAKES